MDEYEVVLPWSPESEAGVLGAIMLKPEAFDDVSDLIDAQAFYDQRAGHIFSAIAALIASDKPVDVLTVADAVSFRGVSLQVVHEFSQAAGTPRHARAYAEKVAEKYRSRQLIEAVASLKATAFDESISVDDRIAQAQSAIEAVGQKKQISQPQPIQNFISGAIDRVQSLADGKVYPGIKTRLGSLDKCLAGGLKGGKLIILAARPSVGKSSLAEQICINIAQDGHPAAMFSMEMSCQEMTDRAICNVGRIDYGRYQVGNLDGEDYGRMTEAIESMRNMPFYFDEQPAMRLTDIASKARSLVRKHGIKLLVIDYLQLCSPSDSRLSRHHQLEEISRGLKALAKQLDITILALSQLNRDITKRTSGRPMLSDLKESGAIEEDADAVILMWSHQKSDGYAINGIDVAKTRGGKTGVFAMHFEGCYQRWTESTIDLNSHENKPTNKYGGEL